MADVTYQPLVYKKDGGNTQIIASGGSVDFEAGTGLKISGSDRAAALATAPAAVAVGYKIARGQLTTATAADTVVTGLATVVSAVASLDSDPSDDPEWVSCTIGDQAGTPAAGSIIVKSWKNTSGTDPTPLAASTFSKKVNWIAIGTQMYVERHEVSITVNASGDGTGYTPVVSGLVRAIRYVPDATIPYDTGFDPTITGDVSGISVLAIVNGGTVAFTVSPRAATHSTAGAAALYAAGGTGVNDLIAVAGERLKIVVAQGGNATTGKFLVFIG